MEVNYKLVYSKPAIKDATFWKASGNNIAQRKITEILIVLKADPYSASPGNPEKLKYIEGFSRRINGKDRITYQINDEKREVLIIRMRGHYEDK